MGVKDLYKFIKNNCPEAIRPRKLTDYEGQILAIDTSNELWKLVCIGDKIGRRSHDGAIFEHIKGILLKVAKAFEHNITLVYVFDGDSPVLKAGTLDARKIARGVDAVRVTSKQYNESKTLLQMLGVPVVESPAEAEAQAAYMNSVGAVDAVITEDIDVFPFGASKMIRSFGSKSMLEVDLTLAASKLHLDAPKIADLCFMLGGDYSTRRNGFGPIRSYDLIVKHSNMENINEIYSSAPFDMALVTSVRDLYLNHPVDKTVTRPKSFGGINVECRDQVIKYIESIYPEAVSYISAAINTITIGLDI